MTRIVIAGCGAVGSRLALELSRPDIELHLYDHDKVDDDNIGTSAFSRYDIGKQKSFALAAMVGARKGVAFALHQDITRKGIRTNEKIDLIVDCLDNRIARNYINGYQDMSTLLHVGVAEGVGEVSWGVQAYRQDTRVNPICTHMLGRNIICLTVGVAAMAIENFLSDETMLNYMINSNGKVMS